MEVKLSMNKFSKEIKEIKNPVVQTLAKDEFSLLKRDIPLIKQNTLLNGSLKSVIQDKKQKFKDFLKDMLLEDKNIMNNESAFHFVYSAKSGTYVGIGIDSHNSG